MRVQVFDWRAAVKTGGVGVGVVGGGKEGIRWNAGYRRWWAEENGLARMRLAKGKGIADNHCNCKGQPAHRKHGGLWAHLFLREILRGSRGCAAR